MPNLPSFRSIWSCTVLITGQLISQLLFGVIFDHACQVWQDQCGEQGSCWIYDSKFLATGMLYLCIITKILTCLSFLGAFCIYKPPPTNGEDLIINDASEMRWSISRHLCDHVFVFFTGSAVSFSRQFVLVSAQRIACMVNLHVHVVCTRWGSLLNVRLTHCVMYFHCTKAAAKLTVYVLKTLKKSFVLSSY